jgi:nucleotide-binding universal stress UspA family protein
MKRRGARLKPLVPFALAALALGGCRALAPPPSDHEPDAATGGGLRRAETEGDHVVYVMPGARLDRYSEVLVDPFMISYATERRPAGSEPHPIRTLDRETEAKLADAMRRAFVHSLRRSRHFSVVEEPGPRALHVQGWIYDLVVGDPQEHRRELPICFAEMTLILTARSSETAQALALVAHRLGTRCEPRRFLDALRWEDVTRALQPWARILSDHLDEVHEIGARPGRAPIR